MNPGGPSRSRDLVGVRRPERRLPSAARSLISLTRWSPRTIDELHPVAVDDHRERLQQRAGGDPERAGDRLDVVIPGVWTSSGASSGGGSATGWASAVATSTLAA